MLEDAADDHGKKFRHHFRGEGVNRIENAWMLDGHLDKLFAALTCCLRPAPMQAQDGGESSLSTAKASYRFEWLVEPEELLLYGGRHPDESKRQKPLLTGDIITLITPDPKKLPLPSPILFQLHAALASLYQKIKSMADIFDEPLPPSGEEADQCTDSVYIDADENASDTTLATWYESVKHYTRLENERPSKNVSGIDEPPPTAVCMSDTKINLIESWLEKALDGLEMDPRQQRPRNPIVSTERPVELTINLSRGLSLQTRHQTSRQFKQDSYRGFSGSIIYGRRHKPGKMAGNLHRRLSCVALCQLAMHAARAYLHVQGRQGNHNCNAYSSHLLDL